MASLDETVRCLNAGRVPYFSFSKMPFLMKRDLDSYTGVHSPESVRGFIHRMPACVRQLLQLFGVAVEEGQRLLVSTYCCATFTASREAIRRHPLSLWRYVYEVVGSGSNQCVFDDHGGTGSHVPGLADLNEG